MRNANLLKRRVSEIRVKRIRVKQGVGVHVKYLPQNRIEIHQNLHCGMHQQEDQQAPPRGTTVACVSKWYSCGVTWH